MIRTSSLARAAVSVLAILAVIAALVCAVIFGYHGYQAYVVDKPVQSARDAAVDGAERAILNVTSVDPRETEEWKKRVEASLTGKALEQISPQDVNKLNGQIKQAGDDVSALTSRLVRSAPVEVDADDNSAKVLVYVTTTAKKLNDAKDGGISQMMGFSVSMTKDGDHWKANDIVPLNSIPIEGDPASNGAPAPGAGTGTGGN